MEVIRHAHPRLGLIVSESDAMVDRSQDESRNGRLSHQSGAVSGLIQQTVHRHERVTGGEIRGRKRPVPCERAVQSESDEKRLARGRAGVDAD
jgi:hypothetical protein